MKITMFMALIIITVLFTSCENNNSDDNASFTIKNAKIYSIDKEYKGNGTVYASYSLGNNDYDDDSYDGFPIGNVRSGKLNITLKTPDISKGGTFVEYFDGIIPDGITISDETAKVFGGGWIVVEESGEYNDLLFCNIPNINIYPYPNRMDRIEYWYFERDVTVSGSFSLSIFHDLMKFHNSFSIDGKAGWNKIYIRQDMRVVNDEYEISITYTTDLSDVPNNLVWFIDENEYEDE